MPNEKKRELNSSNHRSEVLKCIKDSLLDLRTLNALADTFKIMGDGTRLRIVQSLMVRELRVQDLSDIVGLSASAVSHQLRYLRNMRLVGYRKKGREVFYALEDEHIRNLFLEGVEHIVAS